MAPAKGFGERESERDICVYIYILESSAHES